MKTLADFKRRLVPGLSVTVEFPGSVIRGNLGDTVLPGRTVARKVHSVFASGVVWESEAQAGQMGSRLRPARAQLGGAQTAFDCGKCQVSQPLGRPLVDLPSPLAAKPGAFLCVDMARRAVIISAP